MAFLGLVLVFLYLSEVEDTYITVVIGVEIFLFLMLVLSNWKRFISKMNRRVAKKRKMGV